jgi:hypothetical protein
MCVFFFQLPINAAHVHDVSAQRRRLASDTSPGMRVCTRLKAFSDSAISIK